jgi:hypothetical protein
MATLIGIIVGLGTLIWAASRLLEGMSDAKYAARRFRWTHKAKRGERVGSEIHDPREAAAVLLLQMAVYETPLDELDLTDVRSALVGDIALDDDDADGLIEFARLVLKDVGDAANALRKYINPINEACTRAQKDAFLGSLEAISGGAEEALDVQKQFLQSIRRLLLNA